MKLIQVLLYDFFFFFERENYMNIRIALHINFEFN